MQSFQSSLDTCVYAIHVRSACAGSYTVKPVLKKTKKNGFQDNYRLMQVKSIAECWNTFDRH